MLLTPVVSPPSLPPSRTPSEPSATPTTPSVGGLSAASLPASGSAFSAVPVPATSNLTARRWKQGGEQAAVYARCAFQRGNPGTDRHRCFSHSKTVSPEIFDRIRRGGKTYETGYVCDTFGPLVIFKDCCWIRLGHQKTYSHLVALVTDTQTFLNLEDMKQRMPADVSTDWESILATKTAERRSELRSETQQWFATFWTVVAHHECHFHCIRKNRKIVDRIPCEHCKLLGISFA